MIGPDDMRPPLRNALDRVWVEPEPQDTPPTQTVTVVMLDPSAPGGVSTYVHAGVGDVRIHGVDGAGFMHVEYADGRRAGHPLRGVLRWEVAG